MRGLCGLALGALLLFIVQARLVETSLERNIPHVVPLPIVNHDPTSAVTTTSLETRSASTLTPITYFMWPRLQQLSPSQLGDYLVLVAMFAIAYNIFNPFKHVYGSGSPNFEPLIIPLLFFNPFTIFDALRGWLDVVSKTIQ